MQQAELYYNETCRRAAEQERARQHFDTVSITTLGFAGILLGLSPVAGANWSNYSIYPFGASAFAFIVVAAATILGLWSRGNEFQPNLKNLHRNVMSKKYDDECLMLWSAKFMTKTVLKNKKPLRIKACCLRAAFIALAVEALGVIAIFALGVYLRP